MAGFLLLTFYATMAAAGLIVEYVFQAIGIHQPARTAKVIEASIHWNYTTVLDIAFLTLAALLIWRYFRHGGGWRMLKMMNTPIDQHSHHTGHDHHGHGPASQGDPSAKPRPTTSTGIVGGAGPLA